MIVTSLVFSFSMVFKRLQKNFEGKLVGADWAKDLAVLKVHFIAPCLFFYFLKITLLTKFPYAAQTLCLFMAVLTGSFSPIVSHA